jgi:hypothetical protein
MEYKKPPHLRIELYLEHHNCPLAAEWRKAHNEDGFPPFKPVLSQRYNTNKVYLDCEGCGTTISHSIAPADDLERT